MKTGLEKLPKALYAAEDKPLVINDIELPCYVLDNGMRVLSQRGMLKALGMSASGTNKRGEHRLEAFLATKSLNPFITNELIVRIKEPIKFQGLVGGGYALGYDAEVLQSAIRAVSKAYIAGKLTKTQKHIGVRAELLDDAFSKIGLIALIDEATGYQYERESNELQKILKSYISPELLPWEKKIS